MKQRKTLLLVLLSLVLLITLLLILFRPSYIRISMDGVQMQADGTVMLERRITLKGWHLSPLFGQETIKVTKLHVDGYDYSLPQQNASPVFPNMDNANLAGCILLDQANKSISCDFMWAENEEFCLISMDGYFFVFAENGDYQTILDMYLASISISD